MPFKLPPQLVLAQTTAFIGNKKCAQWFRVTQLRAVPVKTMKCGFFFSEVILFNPSGLKQPIKQSLSQLLSAQLLAD